MMEEVKISDSSNVVETDPTMSNSEKANENVAVASGGEVNVEAEAVGVTQSDDSAVAPEMSETTASSSTSSGCGADNDERARQGLADFFESPQQQSLVLSQLARQLEYYFSVQNLRKDTYLQTLRNLNDGCVPVCILANFSKVRSIVRSADDDVRVHAILQAAAEYTDLLKVYSIDTATGKVTTDETPSSANTLLAIRPNNNEPIELSPETMKRTLSVSTLSALNGPSPGAGHKTSNTVIFRDLAPDVSEEEVRALFEFEGCPKIIKMYADIAYCW